MVKSAARDTRQPMTFEVLGAELRDGFVSAIAASRAVAFEVLRAALRTLLGDPSNGFVFPFLLGARLMHP